jgi:hypothetical protein
MGDTAAARATSCIVYCSRKNKRAAGRQKKQWQSVRKTLARRPCGPCVDRLSSNAVAPKRLHRLLKAEASALLAKRRAQVAALEAHLETHNTHTRVLSILSRCEDNEEDMSDMASQVQSLEARLEASASELLLPDSPPLASASEVSGLRRLLLGLLSSVTAKGTGTLQALLGDCDGSELSRLWDGARILSDSVTTARRQGTRVRGSAIEVFGRHQAYQNGGGSSRFGASDRGHGRARGNA